MSIKDNELPAFPADWDYIGSNRAAANGMTLRDYFAAKALPGLMARAWGDQRTGVVPADIYDLWARSAYAAADAMFRARGEA